MMTLNFYSLDMAVIQVLKAANGMKLTLSSNIYHVGPSGMVVYISKDTDVFNLNK